MTLRWVRRKSVVSVNEADQRVGLAETPGVPFEMPVFDCGAADAVLPENAPLLPLQNAELVANSRTATVVDMNFPEWMDWNEFVRSAQTLNGTAGASDDNLGHLGALWSW